MVLFGKSNGQATSEKPVKEPSSLRRISSLIFNEERRPPTSSSNYDDGRVGRPVSINATPPLNSPKDSGFSSWQTTRASSIESRRSSRPASIFSIDTPHGLAQTLLKQGRRLKRHASKLSLNSLNGDGRDSASLRDTASPSLSVRSSMDLGPATPVISGPSNFQHITHAKPQQFSHIDCARDNDLIADFSALRASQASRTDLRGIRADDLSSRSSSMDLSAVPSLGSASSRDSLVSSGLSTPGSRMSIRSTRSKDSFSQLHPKARKNRLGPPPVAPPRISSKWAFTRGHRRNTSSESSLGEVRCSDDGSSVYASDQELQHSPILVSPGVDGFDYPRDYHAVSTEGEFAYEHEQWYYPPYDNILPCVQEEEAMLEYEEHEPMQYKASDQFLKPPEVRSSGASGTSDSTIKPDEKSNRDSAVEVSPENTPKKTKFRPNPSTTSKTAKAASKGSLFSSWRGSDDDSDSDIDPFVKSGSSHTFRKPANNKNHSVPATTQQRKPWRAPGASTEPAGKGYTPKLNKPLPSLPIPKISKSPSSRPQTPKSPKSSKVELAAPKTEEIKIAEPETPETPKQVNGVSATVEGTTIKLTPGFFAKGASSATHHMVQVNLKQLHDTLAQLESQFPTAQDLEESPQKPSRIPVSSALKTALRRPSTPSRKKVVAFASDTVSPIPRPSKIPTMTALPQRAF